MKKPLLSKKTILVLDSLVIVLCVIGVYNISNKSRLPVEIQNINSKLVVSHVDTTIQQIKENDQVLSLNNIFIESVEEIEIFLDGELSGESINITLLRENQEINLKIQLTSFYSIFYILVAIIVGAMFFVVALIVLLKCDNNNTAVNLHWALIFTAMIILLTWGNYNSPTPTLGYLTRAGFHFGYLFAPIMFLRFVTSFPIKIEFNFKPMFRVLVTISFILFLVLNFTFYKYLLHKDLPYMRQYITAFDISSILIVIVAVSAIILFLYTYKTSSVEVERKKIRWILLGFILGPLSYFVFWVIPSRLWNNPILPEPIVLLLVSFVPITFGIAIIKYRVLNIDIIIRRSMVYPVVISFLLILYMLLISFLARIFNSPDSQIVSIISALSIALLFQPLKNKVRQVVDKKFFRVEYDYRQSVNSFLKEIKDIYNQESLINRTLEFINNIIPTEKIVFYWYEKECLIKPVTLNPINLAHEKLKFSFTNINCSLPIAKPYTVEAGIKTEEMPTELIKLDAELIFILNSNRSIFHGIIALGKRKSDTVFTLEDIDLLTIITTRIAIILDRIKLQEDIIKEKIESERLEELNKLKSFFVSSISHDLKTPITSIKMFAEKLRSPNKISEEKTKNYLKIIEGESNRLTRLIDNVLDFAKIEAGAQVYNISNVNIVEVIRNILNSLEYQIQMSNFDVKVKMESDEIFLCVDVDAFTQAILNLLSNSLKYFSSVKYIEIIARKRKDNVLIEINDKGKGIPEKEVERILDPFYRSKEIADLKSKGTGLGLAIVKHFIDAHGAKLNIQSKQGLGTNIKLIFPNGINHEKNIIG